MIDTSSSSPFHTRALGADLKNLSIDLIDSPITQEELHAIDSGGATLMVGSDSDSALQKILPILKNMSTHVFHMGKLGTGHTMKTLNNYVSVGSIIALCDALVSPTSSSSLSIPRACKLHRGQTLMDCVGYRTKTRTGTPTND